MHVSIYTYAQINRETDRQSGACNKKEDLNLERLRRDISAGLEGL